MSTAPAVPRLSRVPPGVWIALAWSSSNGYAILTSHHPREGWHPSSPWNALIFATVLTLAGGMLLVRHPITAHALIVGGAVGSALTLNSTAIVFAQFATVAVSLTWIAGARPRRASLAALAIMLGALTAYGVVRTFINQPFALLAQVSVALTSIVMWFIGDTSRQSREHAREVGAHVMAEVAATERLRIARELHDMIAHTVGVIALQAGAASMLIDAEPDKAREAVHAIESTSRETLSGLRRMLVSLRNQDSDSEGSAPMPGMAEVDRLAATTTAAGVRVDVDWRGGRRPLPADIELAAFRIVQESVTNVVRHAGADSCRVVLTFAPEELAVEVTDDGLGIEALAGVGARATNPAAARAGHAGHAGHAGSGFGLMGIRERVALLRGEFAAGPRAEGGFRVAARLPIPEPGT